MSNTWGRPPQQDESVYEAPVGPEPGGGQWKWGVLVAGAVVLVGAVAVGGGRAIVGGGGDGDVTAGPGFTAAPTTTTADDADGGDNTDAADGIDGAEAELTAAEVVVTETVTVQPEKPRAAPLPAPEPDAPAQHSAPARNSSGGVPTCDGRGVLIVNSVMGNSPSFDREVSTALSQNPGALVLPPDTCPSLRSYTDGTSVTAVVIDYGDDLSSLCTAEAQGRGNARLLNSDTSYSSPC
ncbi:hypothetical protein [Corynebacterium provencense]|uniref:hypothetical protein n=1 Tax=Corynebacterium provencense TaxID=1737425 RepID=UPI000A8203EF|nr:hypothetical protein [Corynebacterium provencense]